jgi:hypothetical protein
MPNPLLSLRRDQLIPVNKAVNEKEELEKGLEEEEEKRGPRSHRQNIAYGRWYNFKKLSFVSFVITNVIT